MPFIIKEITESEICISAVIIRQSFLTVAKAFGLTKENTPTNGAFIKDVKLMDDFNRGISMFGLFDDKQQIGFVAVERNDNETFFLEK